MLATKTFKPYVEGGIGAIYTDYRWEGQGTRFNFNPQLGIGTEINTTSGNSFLMALRLYHVSNAGLSKENRGLNAITLHIGRFF
jgi:lipid A 3-O-deacylase